MSTNETWAKAGLVFLNPRAFDIVELANQVVKNCETLGHRATALHILSETSAYICLGGFELSVTLQTDAPFAALPHPAGTYLALAVACSDAAPGKKPGTQFARDSLLARSLQALHAETRPDYVRWIDTDVLITSEVFAAAAGPVREETRRKVITAPRRRPSRAAILPDIEATNAALQHRLKAQDPLIFEAHSAPDRLRKVFTESPEPAVTREPAKPRKPADHPVETSPLRRLTAWALSIAVLVLVLPVGLALLVVNFIRGENLRLACHTAALTGTFVTLQGSFASAATLEALTSLLR